MLWASARLFPRLSQFHICCLLLLEVGAARTLQGLQWGFHGNGRTPSALRPTAWQRVHNTSQVTEQKGEPGAHLITAVALELLPEPPETLRSHTGSPVVAVKLEQVLS